MNNPCDLLVTLEAGTVRRVVTLRDIVHEHGDPGLAGKLAALAFGPESGSVGERREPTEGSEGRLPESGTLNAQESLELRWRSGSGEGAGGERGTAPPRDDPEHVADHLARVLRDERSLAFYRLVARVVSREVIRDALARACDARSVRRSRAALFVHLVRPYLPRRSLTEAPNS